MFDIEQRERERREREALAAEREREQQAEIAELRAEIENMKRCRFLWLLSLSDTTTRSPESFGDAMQGKGQPQRQPPMQATTRR